MSIWGVWFITAVKMICDIAQIFYYSAHKWLLSISLKWPPIIIFEMTKDNRQSLRLKIWTFTLTLGTRAVYGIVFWSVHHTWFIGRAFFYTTYWVIKWINFCKNNIVLNHLLLGFIVWLGTLLGSSFVWSKCFFMGHLV